MVSKNFILALSLLATSSLFAGTMYENIYVTPNIDNHLPEFLAMEITKDFKASIDEYNRNRKDPKYFLAKIKDEKIAKIFQKITHKITLPEIKEKKDSPYYVIAAGKNKIEFSTALFLTKKYYLNGVEKSVKSEDFVAANQAPVTQIYVYNLLSSLIATANADEQEDFADAYNNLDTTKVLMAGIVALDSSFKERSVVDKVSLFGDTADANLKNLVKKIEQYQAQCEEGLNAQAGMNYTSDEGWRNLGPIDQYNIMRALRDTADPTYQATLIMVRKIARENAASSLQRNDTLVSYLNIDKKAPKCEAMMKSLVDESKAGTNVLAAWVDRGNSGNVAFDKHPCTKLTKLKMCLSQFATQAVEINDFVRRRGSEAKDLGVNVYSVPNNYPVENSSK